MINYLNFLISHGLIFLQSTIFVIYKQSYISSVSRTLRNIISYFYKIIKKKYLF